MIDADHQVWMSSCSADTMCPLGTAQAIPVTSVSNGNREVYVNCQCPYCKCLAHQRQLAYCHTHATFMHHLLQLQLSTIDWQLAYFEDCPVSTYLTDLCRPPMSRWTDCRRRISPMTQPPSELEKCKFFKMLFFLNWFFSRAFCSVFNDKFVRVQKFIHVQQFPSMMPLLSHLC